MRISVEIGMHENEKRIRKKDDFIGKKIDCLICFCFRKYKLRISAEIGMHEKKKRIRKKDDFIGKKIDSLIFVF